MFRITKPLTAALVLGSLTAPALADPLIIADARLRYETVDSAAFAQEAEAWTLRARLGLQADLFDAVTGLIEASLTMPLGDEDYNSTVNGKAAFPVVADPKSSTLNRAQLAFTPIEGVTAVVGRQRLILQDARFIGNVGWRQQEQTFDAARVTAKPLEGLTIDYAYLIQANRIFGSNSPMGTHDLDGHVVEAAYKTGFGITATGFFHDIENEDAQMLSLRTYGARIEGGFDVGDGVTLLVDAAYARQKEAGQNPISRSHSFTRVIGGVKYEGVIAKAGFEQLDGNGTTAFQTPLATGHKFQGFADLFLATPAMGLKDQFVLVTYKGDALHGLKPTIAYHKFEAETGGMDYGQEIDAVLGYTVNKHLSFNAKYADYNADGFGADTQKLWLAAELKY